MIELIRKRVHYFFPQIILLIMWAIAGCDVTGENPSENESPDNNKSDKIYSQTDYQWYKGNLHSHSYWSNGYDYPEMVLDWYKNKGYNFAVISPHNALPEGEKWIEAEKGSHAEKMFKNYRKAYGEDWVEYKDQDSLYRVRLKAQEEYKSRIEESGNFLVLSSEEIDYREEDSLLLHVNVTNVQEVIEPQSGGSVTEILQNTIDIVQAQSDQFGIPVISQVNHPNINWSISADDLKPLEGLRFFEVYNGHPNARNSGDVNHFSTDQIWDEVNTHYLINDKSRLFGLAVDDAHWYDIAYSSPGRGWIQVQSPELSTKALLEALQRGDFYASTGVRLADIQFDGNSLTVRIEGEEGVNYTTQYIGTRKGEPENPGVILAESQGLESGYTLSGDELYVRAKIISDKSKENPSEDGEVEVAWVQPVVGY